MTAESLHVGLCAAPGLASGPIFILQKAANAERVTKGPDTELAALQGAMAASIADIRDIQKACDPTAAEMLEFQVALLEDEALLEPALAQLSAGMAADAAWRRALDAQIADYQNSTEEYFRARASDLIDIRDRVLDHLTGSGGGNEIPAGSIILASELPPSRFLTMDWSQGGGIGLVGGSPTSHVAMLARARGIPMVVGLKVNLSNLQASFALLDGESGALHLDPKIESKRDFDIRRKDLRAAKARWAEYLPRPARTADGERIAVMMNVADPDELAGLDASHCDGIGLVRTEFLFHRSDSLPSEEQQFATYRRILDWARGRPVTIRTLDAGGDKPIPGLTINDESNSFLGVRGIRLSLARPEVFRIQLRALARAAAHGPLKIMLPMVTIPEELEQARQLLNTAIDELANEGLETARPQLGIMVEVPSAAISIHRFDADFFSIGSNDLTQYVTAAARDNAAVAGLNNTADPAVLELISRVAQHGAAASKEVSLCGDAAGDAKLLPVLLEAGIRSVSVAPALLAQAKATIATWSRTGTRP